MSEKTGPEQDRPAVKFLGKLETAAEEGPSPFDAEDTTLVPLAGNNGEHRGQAPLQVFMREDVYAQTMRYAKENDDREIGGVLLGQRLRHPETGAEFIDIQVFVPARHAAERSASFTFTVESMQAFYEERDQTYKDLAILGWFHSHPGFGIFLSSMDLFLHRQFFPKTWQVAYVVDPHSHRVGMFHNHGDDEILPAEDVFVYSSESEGRGAGGEVAVPLEAFSAELDERLSGMLAFLQEEFDSLHPQPELPPTPKERLWLPAPLAAVLAVGGVLLLALMLVAGLQLRAIGQTSEGMRSLGLLAQGQSDASGERQRTGDALSDGFGAVETALEESRRQQEFLARNQELLILTLQEMKQARQEPPQIALPDDAEGVFVRLRAGDTLDAVARWHYGDVSADVVSYLAAINQLAPEDPVEADLYVFLPAFPDAP